MNELKKCLQCNQTFESELENCPYCSSVDVEEIEEATDDVTETEEVTDNVTETEEVTDDVSEEPEEENVDDILENSLPKYEYTYKEKSKAPLYVLLGVLAAAIIAAIVYLYLFKVVPSTPVKNMILSQYNGKMEEYFTYLYPPTASKAEENFNANYGSAEDYNTKLQTSFTETYGEGYTVSVQVLDVDRATDQMLEAFLSEIEDETEKAKITDLVYVTAKLKVQGDISTDIASSMGTAVKYDGEWYVYQ